jgi:hypothetical protein
MEAMETMGCSPRSPGWPSATPGPYDTYITPGHPLCCAGAPRELQAVTAAAAGGQWWWAAQAAESIAAMQALVCEAICQGREAADPVADQVNTEGSQALPQRDTGDSSRPCLPPRCAACVRSPGW